MKKIIIIFLFILLTITSFSEENEVNLFINTLPINSENKVLDINGEIIVPMIELFEDLGAKVYTGDIITGYYLNTFIKIDTKNNYYAINGKKYNYDDFMHNDVVYIPLEALNIFFDFDIEEYSNGNLYINPNKIIRYNSYNNIPYRDINLKDREVRFSLPLDWIKYNDNKYGYSSNFGEVNVTCYTQKLNDNINTDIIIDTYVEHLTINPNVILGKLLKKNYNYLNSNVLYFTENVNEIIQKHIVNFIKTDNKVFIVEFQYPEQLSEPFILGVIEDIMNTFYIDGSSIDTSSEHYIELNAFRNYNCNLTTEIYGNMTVYNHLELKGYFDTKEKIEGLSVIVSRGDDKIESYVPVVNNSFSKIIYTPFGLGKHNIKISIDSKEDKIALSDFNKRESPKTLIKCSVVNINNKNIRYIIPTKYIPCKNRNISSLAKLLSRNDFTTYSKAISLYNYIKDDIKIIDNDEGDVIDVHNNYEGSTYNTTLYLATLLRSINIPTRVMQSTGIYNHTWVESYINGKWIIINPFDYTSIDEINILREIEIKRGFNIDRDNIYSKLENIIILDY